MLSGRTFTAADFAQQRRGPLLGDYWQATVPLDNPLGPFGVEIDTLPDAELLHRVNEYAAALADQYDAVFTIVHDDYLRASEDGQWMKSCGVPRRLREDRVMRYIRSRTIYVGRGQNGVVGGYAFISPEWESKYGLRLVLHNGRLVSSPG